MARAKTLKLKAGTNIQIDKNEQDKSVVVSCISNGPSTINDAIKIYDIKVIFNASDPSDVEFQGLPQTGTELTDFIDFILDTNNTVILKAEHQTPGGSAVYKTTYIYYLQKINPWLGGWQPGQDIQGWYTLSFVAIDIITSAVYRVISARIDKNAAGECSIIWSVTSL